MTKPDNTSTPINTPAFMRWAMLTPLVVPVLLILLNLLFKQFPALQPARSYLHGFGGFMMIASAIAFIPYLVFTVVSWKKLKAMNRISSIKYVLYSPVVFFLYQGIFLFIFALASAATHGFQSLAPRLLSTLAISAFVFPVGYGYVAFILILYTIVRRFWLAKANGKRYLFFKGDTP